jgi:hypothetical protein
MLHPVKISSNRFPIESFKKNIGGRKYASIILNFNAFNFITEKNTV